MNTAKIPPCSESTITQRYQTTIPAPVRQALNISKNDKILYTIEADNRVVISRVIKDTQSDPVLEKFLDFIETDIKNDPKNIEAISSDLVLRAKSLVQGVDLDLNAPLKDEEE